jgi:vanillate O-demethylase ferredoxin subunit
VSGLIRVRVATRREEALDICGLDLVAASGGALPAFTAGAHIDLHLPGGLVRPYSLCNAPGDTAVFQIAVLRDPASRGGSIAVHEHLHPGAELDISAPRNQFALDEAASHHLLLAGGIGITPLLAMAERLAARGTAFALHHCTRSSECTPFVDRVATSAFAHRVHHHRDDSGATQRLNIHQTLSSAPSGSHLYVCGPTGFMDAMLNAAQAAGWSEARLHREYFGAALPGANSSVGFELEIASSGRVIRVAPNQSALAALRSAGLDIPMSCEQGVCGTCLTGLKAGVPDHRDQYLTPEERAANNQFLPCCSRAIGSRLVLEL